MRPGFGPDLCKLFRPGPLFLGPGITSADLVFLRLLESGQPLLGPGMVYVIKSPQSSILAVLDKASVLDLFVRRGYMLLLTRSCVG